MAQPRMLPQPEWAAFFARVSDALLGKRAEIEVASLDLGDQIVAEWAPMIGLTYDAEDDLLDVAIAGGTSHFIRQPKQILVEEAPEGVKSVAVLDAAGARQIVRFKDPLMLTSGAGRR